MSRTAVKAPAEVTCRIQSIEQAVKSTIRQVARPQIRDTMWAAWTEAKAAATASAPGLYRFEMPQEDPELRVRGVGRWLRSGIEDTLDVTGACRSSSLIEGRRDAALDMRPEPILVVRHPSEQRCHGVRRFGGHGLPCGRPAGEQAAAERAEVPA